MVVAFAVCEADFGADDLLRQSRALRQQPRQQRQQQQQQPLRPPQQQQQQQPQQRRSRPSAPQPIENRRLATDRPAPDRLPVERQVINRPASDRPPVDRPAVAERLVSERPAAERLAPERPVAERLTAERPVASRPVPDQPIAKRSNDVNRFSSFGLTEAELNGPGYGRPAPVQQGYPESSVGYRRRINPLGFLESTLRFLSHHLVSHTQLSQTLSAEYQDSW